MRGLEETDRLVAEVVSDLWAGLDQPACVAGVYGFPNAWDVEGFVRVTAGPPVSVEVLAVVAVCDPTPTLLEELNSLNAASRWVRFFADPQGQGQVYVTYGLLAEAVTPLTLSAAVDWVRCAADEFGPLLRLL
jgi:hypothetical protein